MKLLKVVGCAALMFCSYLAFAQTGAPEITDEELTKYAVAMDSIDDMKADLLKSISEFVKNNDKISGARYNELSKIINDEQKLTEAKATPEEIAAVKEVLAKKDEGTAKIQETIQTLAKEYVGASVYNKVKKALATDAEIKSRYEAILAEVNKKDKA
jgi:hypothetical protein